MIFNNKNRIDGNFFFKYRGQIPILLFILVLPYLYLTDTTSLTSLHIRIYIFLCISFIILGFIIRFYTIATTLKHTSGRNRDIQIAETLNTKGIYSLLRHPLYLGNYLIWVGVSLYTYNIFFTITISILFFIYYKIIINTEEEFLEKKFGDEYLEWKIRTSRFIPSISTFRPSRNKFSVRSILRREYAGLLATSISVVFIEGFRNYFDQTIGIWKVSSLTICMLSIIIIISIFLKLIKKHTSFLNEINRT